MKVCIFFSILNFHLSGCSQSKPEYLSITNPDGSKVFKTENEIYKDYALCSCLNYSLKKDSVTYKDNSMETLVDLSYDHLNADKTRILDSLAADYVNSLAENKGETFENRKSPFFDCILFYKSKKLEETIDNLIQISNKKNKPD